MPKFLLKLRYTLCMHSPIPSVTLRYVLVDLKHKKAMLFIQVMYEDNLLKWQWIMLLKVVSARPFFNNVNIEVLIRLYLNMAVNFVSGKHFPVTTIFGYTFSWFLFTEKKCSPCIEETVISHSLLYFLFCDIPKSIWLRQLFRKLIYLSLSLLSKEQWKLLKN